MKNRERVKTWLKTAWHIEQFADLNPQQFERLLQKLESWASEEYAKAESQTALSREYNLESIGD